MSVTESVLRLLASGRDPAAMLALLRQAMRTNDHTLMDFVNETAKIRLREIEAEQFLWESCLNEISISETGIVGEEMALILTKVGQRRIEVIKEVRSRTGLGVREAKAAVDNVPSILVNNISDPHTAMVAVLRFKSLGAEAFWKNPKWANKFGKTVYFTGVKSIRPE